MLCCCLTFSEKILASSTKRQQCSQSVRLLDFLKHSSVCFDSNGGYKLHESNSPKTRTWSARPATERRWALSELRRTAKACQYVSIGSKTTLPPLIFFFYDVQFHNPYDCCPVITLPDTFKCATINIFIMAMATQWQGSVLEVNPQRIISWICGSLWLKRGFVRSLSPLFSGQPRLVILAHLHHSLQKGIWGKVSDQQQEWRYYLSWY